MPQNFPERKRNRLYGYDYARGGWYFVTICVQGRRRIFGFIKNGEMVMNRYGKILQREWIWLSQQYDYVQLDGFVVMPDHFHGILGITNVGMGRDPSLPIPKIKSLSELIGAFKTRSSKYIHQCGCEWFLWQKSFYDHIIRDHDDFLRIRQYISDNPRNWNG